MTIICLLLKRYVNIKGTVIYEILLFLVSNITFARLLELLSSVETDRYLFVFPYVYQSFIVYYFINSFCRNARYKNYTNVNETRSTQQA